MASLVALVLVVAFFGVVKPWPDNHVQYETAKVVAIAPRPSDTGVQRSVLDLVLQDGQQTRLSVRNRKLAGTRDLVCLERRQRFKAGKTYFLLHPLAVCTAGK